MFRRLSGHPRISLAVVMCAGLFLSDAAFAQTNTARIGGSVKDDKGQPVEGAKISIDSPSSGRHFETKTDKKGEFIQLGLQPGPYKIVASKEKLSSLPSQVNVRAGGAPMSLNLVLMAGSNVSPEQQAKMKQMLAFFEEGIQASLASRSDEAIEKFNKAIELNENCADCYFNIGVANMEKKDWASAEEALKKAVQMKPGFSDASFNLGLVLWNSGKIAESKALFEDVTKSDPTNAEAHYQLAMCLVNEGNMAGAVEQFEIYVKASPDGPNAAQAQALLGQLKK
jgi:tetratricopeptide (TPR) repeat protein